MSRQYNRKELPTKVHEKAKYAHGKAKSRIITTEYADNWLDYPDEVKRDFAAFQSFSDYMDSLKAYFRTFLEHKNLPSTSSVFSQIKAPKPTKAITEILEDPALSDWDKAIRISPLYSNLTKPLFLRAKYTSHSFEEKKGFLNGSKSLTAYLKENRNYTHDDLETIAARIIELIDRINTEHPFASSPQQVKNFALVELGELKTLFKIYRKDLPKQEERAKRKRTPVIEQVIIKIARIKQHTNKSAKDLWPELVDYLSQSDDIVDVQSHTQNANQPKTWFVTYYLNKDNAAQKTMTFGTFSKKLSEAKKLIP